MNAITDSEEILQMTKQLLRLSNNDQSKWLRELIEQRWRDLNTNETLIISHCVMTVTNNKFYLPADCKRILAFRDQGSCIQGVFVDFSFFQACNCTMSNLNPLIRLLDINGRWANFIGLVPDGTKVEIAYQVVNLEINEEAYTAIAKYVAYQYALSYPELYTPEQRRDWRADGVYGGARVRGAAARRKFEQDKVQIRSLMTQMVNGMSPSVLAGTYNSFFYPSVNSINI